MIPKNIFRTWYTDDLHPEIQNQINRIKELNPNYNHQIYTDEEIDKFVNENYPGEIADAYNRLNIIVAKVDFWRYLVLYKYGGVYVDMDSTININLDNFIRDSDEAIITAENNPNYYVQWALIYNKGHPILKKTIDLIVDNIKNNTYPNDIIKMTGPGVYSKAVELVHAELFGSKYDHSTITKETDVTFEKNGTSYRFFSIDYYKEEYITFKCNHWWQLFQYKNKKQWRDEAAEKPLLL